MQTPRLWTCWLRPWEPGPGWSAAVPLERPSEGHITRFLMRIIPISNYCISFLHYIKLLIIYDNLPSILGKLYSDGYSNSCIIFFIWLVVVVVIFNYVQADFGMMNLLSHVFFWMNDAVVFLVYVQIIFNLSISRLVSEVGYSAAASACEKGERWKWAIWAADCGLNIAWGMVAAIWECLKVVCTATSNDTLDWGKYRKTVI